jgi:membrane-associated HD superfamily phosphohydrolase
MNEQKNNGNSCLVQLIAIVIITITLYFIGCDIWDPQRFYNLLLFLGCFILSTLLIFFVDFVFCIIKYIIQFIKDFNNDIQ